MKSRVRISLKLSAGSENMYNFFTVRAYLLLKVYKDYRIKLIHTQILCEFFYQNDSVKILILARK